MPGSLLTQRERIMYAVNGILIKEGPTAAIEFLQDMISYCGSPIIKEVVSVTATDSVDSAGDDDEGGVA